MARFTSGRILLLGTLQFLFASHPAMAQQQAEWTWKDHFGHVRKSEDLHRILAQHETWLTSNGSRGKQADLSGADLRGADLSAARLSRALLTSANLVNANLTSADLSNANLERSVLGRVKPLPSAPPQVVRGMMVSNTVTVTVVRKPLCPASAPDEPQSLRFESANLTRTNLTNAMMSGADLTGANLRSAFLTKVQLESSILGEADLTSSNLEGVNFRNASLVWTQLYHAKLSSADLTNTNLSSANLAYADLTDAQLSGADFSRVTLCGAMFEPQTTPSVSRLASAFWLEYVTYGENPVALVQARKQFNDGGFDAQERKLTFAIKKGQELALRQNCKNGDWLDCIGYAFNFVLFDATCQYGMSPGRALKFGAGLWLLCSVLYFAFTRTPGKTGLYRILGASLQEDPSAHRDVKQVLRKSGDYTWGRLYFLQWLWREWLVLRTAMFFSLMSAFNIGFRDINFGRWLRLLTREEFDIRAVGWARVVSGWQSLISVLLIALWVLTYFGRPFG